MVLGIWRHANEPQVTPGLARELAWGRTIWFGRSALVGFQIGGRGLAPLRRDIKRNPLPFHQGA